MMRPSIPRTTTVVALALSALVLSASGTASVASAQNRGQAQVANEGGKSTVRFDPFGVLAARNLLSVRWDPVNGGLMFADPQGGMQAGNGCSGGPIQLLCPVPSPDLIRALTVQLGRGADRFQGIPPGAPVPPPRVVPRPWSISGGFGPDAFEGGRVDERIGGGPGPDRINGGKGNDKLYGGDGRDVITGGPGGDVLNGGPGSDVLRDGARGASGGGARAAGGSKQGPDVFRGGLLVDRFRVEVGYRTVDRVHCGRGRDRVKLVFSDLSSMEMTAKMLDTLGARRLGAAKFELPPAVRIRPRQRSLVFLNDCEIARLLSR